MEVKLYDDGICSNIFYHHDIRRYKAWW